MERKVATVNSSNLKNLLKRMGNDIAKEMAKTVSEELVIQVIIADGNSLQEKGYMSLILVQKAMLHMQA